MNEKEKPLYYDGSGYIELPKRDTSKEIVVKPDIKIEPIPFPVFPYYPE